MPSCGKQHSESARALISRMIYHSRNKNGAFIWKGALAVGHVYINLRQFFVTTAINDIVEDLQGCAERFRTRP